MQVNLQQALLTQALVNSAAVLELQTELAKANAEIVRLCAALDQATKGEGRQAGANGAGTIGVETVATGGPDGG